MIKRWKMSPVSTEKEENQFVIYIQGDKENAQEVVNKFDKICRAPFEINQDDFNWAFYIINSTEEQRSKIGEILDQLTEKTGVQKPKGKLETEDELRSLVNEVKKVIQDLDKKGLTLEELKSIEDKTAAQETIEKREEVKVKGDRKKPEEHKSEEIAIGYLFPVEDNQKFNIFMGTLSDIEKVTSKKPIELNKVFSEAYDPFDKDFKLNSVVRIIKAHEIETLVLLTPDSRMIPKEKEIIEELKRRLKRKVLFKIIPLPKIGKRSIYLDLIVDIALFKGKGLEYFKLKH